MPSKTLVFDIDDTLVTAHERKIAVLNQVASDPALQNIPNIQRLALLTPDSPIINYNIGGELKACGIAEADQSRVTEAWFKIFLTNASLYHRGKIISRPVHGAVEFVNTARSRGLHIVYLTGRQHDPDHHNSLREGTLDELQTHGFPLPNNDDVELFMKDVALPGCVPSYIRAEVDAAFKKRILTDVNHRHPILATFDDYPPNVRLFTQHFPAITHYAILMTATPADFPSTATCIRNFTDPQVTPCLQTV